MWSANSHEIGRFFSLAVLAYGHSVYAGILVLIFDIQSDLCHVCVLRYYVATISKENHVFRYLLMYCMKLQAAELGH